MKMNLGGVHMSLSKNIRFNCEECGKEFEVEIHESINAILEIMKEYNVI
jgi:transposase-like protein